MAANPGIALNEMSVKQTPVPVPAVDIKQEREKQVIAKVTVKKFPKYFTDILVFEAAPSSSISKSLTLL